jgi:hypothetical protein
MAYNECEIGKIPDGKFYALYRFDSLEEAFDFKRKALYAMNVDLPQMQRLHEVLELAKGFSGDLNEILSNID